MKKIIEVRGWEKEKDGRYFLKTKNGIVLGKVGYYHPEINPDIMVFFSNIPLNNIMTIHESIVQGKEYVEKYWGIETATERLER